MYEAGAVFSPSVLDITTDDLIKRFMEGVTRVAALSLQIGYPTVASVPHSIVNGFKNLLAIAVATDITFPEAEQVRMRERRSREEEEEEEDRRGGGRGTNSN